LLGAGGDRKVTPGVTGSSRARAPIDPAVWYLGPLRALGQNRGNAIEVSAEKYEYRLISAKPDLLYPGRPQGRNGKSGRGRRRGKSNGIISTRSDGRSNEDIDAVNGVPAAAFVKLADGAVDRRGCIFAFLWGAAAICAAHDETRRQERFGNNSGVVLNTPRG